MSISLIACDNRQDTLSTNSNPKNEATMKKTKVLFVLSSHGVKGSTGEPTGWYLSEAAHPWKVLHDHGIEVDFVSPKGGKPPVDGFDLKDPINKLFWENTDVQKKLENTFTPNQIDPKNYQAIHFVGGHGAMWDFPENTALAKLAADIYENNGLVSAVCHGPAGLVNIKLSNGSYLVAGKKVAAFTNEEEEQVGLTKVVPFLLAEKLKERGAVHVPAANWTNNVQIDGRLITGQNPQSAETVGEKIASLLK
jgi:putative intracellular protease/amidase